MSSQQDNVPVVVVEGKGANNSVSVKGPGDVLLGHWFNCSCCCSSGTFFQQDKTNSWKGSKIPT